LKTREDAIANYQRGITQFGGYATYAGCGNQGNGNFYAVAECLHNAKKTARTTDTMVANYRKAAGG
jgi:hypothetical protein